VRPAQSGQSPEKFLVILLSEMGSIVLAGPMFAALRQRYPGATLHVLQLKKNQEVSKLLSAHRAGASCMHWMTAPVGCSSATSGALAWRCAVCRLDAVIDCELFSRISSLLSFWCGAAGARRLYAAYPRRFVPRQFYQPQPFPYNPYQHISKQFLSWWMHWNPNPCRATRPAPPRELPWRHGFGSEL
jgi:ADP-heptose:LPS heptosyltransferase